MPPFFKIMYYLNFIPETFLSQYGKWSIFGTTFRRDGTRKVLPKLKSRHPISNEKVLD
jgi:hypothetical protein